MLNVRAQDDITKRQIFIEWGTAMRTIPSLIVPLRYDSFHMTCGEGTVTAKLQDMPGSVANRAEAKTRPKSGPVEDNLSTRCCCQFMESS